MSKNQSPQTVLSNAKKIGCKVSGKLHTGQAFSGFPYSLESRGGKAYWEVKADRNIEGITFASDDVAEIEMI